MWIFFFLFQTTHLAMIKNTTKPLEGLKVLLYQLFTIDKVRQSSLKGRVTASGGEGVALDREKLDLIYCKLYSLEIVSLGFYKL